MSVFGCKKGEIPNYAAKITIFFQINVQKTKIIAIFAHISCNKGIKVT